METYECSDCGKRFTRKDHYDAHMNRKYPCNMDTTICPQCGKHFSNSSSCARHKKTCGKENTVTFVEKQIVENQQNMEQNIENNVENMNVDGDVKVVKFGDENLSYISDDTFKKIIGRGFKSLEEFMNHVHFNKDHPENHNIYVASMKDGHVVTYNGERWDVGISDQVLDDIIQQKSDILEEKYDEIVDKLSPMESH
jgi:hypothetical protein